MTVYENLKAISEITLKNKSYQEEKVNSLLSKFELDNVRNISADVLSGGQKRRLTIALFSFRTKNFTDGSLLALDIMTIKTLQEIIIDLQTNNNLSILISDHTQMIF